MKELVGSVDQDLLYLRSPATSVGEQILRSAAVMEQTFGGLTANLWDDPFEWTLPETLSTPESIVEHLSEVDSMRKRVFESIDGDGALGKYVAVPSGKAKTLGELLIETLGRACDHHGRAVTTLKMSHKKAQKTQN